jgi:proteasome lid subunit RPN8/RPN11
MIEYFPSSIIEDAKAHARKEFPKESIGIVVDNEYIPCENVHSEPEEHFKLHPRVWLHYIKERKIQALIHSHNDYPHASVHDWYEQVRSKVPWGIINMRNGNYESHFFWGEGLPIQDLVGRMFHQGTYDCFGLLRDFFLKGGLEVPDYPREYMWWSEDGNDVIMNGLKSAPFDIIPFHEAKPGDGLLYSIPHYSNWKHDLINHCGIYVSESKVLHHFVKRLSGTKGINFFRKSLKYVVRHRDRDKMKPIEEIIQ